MLQSQFYNINLKNKHINKMVENYNLKYSRMKNEIESRMNYMIKTFLKDVRDFLENIEEIAEQKKKLSNYKRIKKELELTKSKLKDKTFSENKIKSDYDLIKQENTLLKLKIKSLNDKIANFNKQNPSPKISPKLMCTPKNISEKGIFKLNLDTPRTVRTVVHNLHTKSNDFTVKRSRLAKGFRDDKHDKSFSNIDKTQLKKNYDKMIKERNLNNNKKKKINVNKFVNNNIKSNNGTNLSDDEYYLEISDNSILPLSTPTNFQKYFSTKNNKGSNSPRLINSKSNDTVNMSLELQSSCLNTMNNVEYEEMGINLNNILEDELKELEKDEKNVKLLIEQIGLYDKII